MKQNQRKFFWKRLFYVYLIACVFMGTIGTTLFIMIANHQWIDEAEVYFSQNEEIKEEIGVCEKIKCEGRAPKADKIGLPVDFIVKTEKGTYNITLWMNQKKMGAILL